MVVVEVAEADAEVLRAQTPHLWVEVDAGNCFSYRRSLRQPLACGSALHGVSRACPSFITGTDAVLQVIFHLGVRHARPSTSWRSVLVFPY